MGDFEIVLDNIVNSIKNAFSDNLLSIGFFGSRAGGDYNDKSDWDFFVLIKNITDDEFIKSALKTIDEDLKDYDYDIHPNTFKEEDMNKIHVLNMINEIRRDGKILFDKNNRLNMKIEELRLLKL